MKNVNEIRPKIGQVAKMNSPTVALKNPLSLIQPLAKIAGKKNFIRIHFKINVKMNYLEGRHVINGSTLLINALGQGPIRTPR